MITNEQLAAYLDGNAWIKVRRFSPPAVASAEERLRLFDEHHVAETTFLIDQVRLLAQALLDERRRGP